MNMLGNFVITARKRAGYDTQKAFAEAVGRDQAWVSRLERGVGKETPPPEDVALLAKVLHVSQLELLAAAGYDLDAGPVEDHPLIAFLRPIIEGHTFSQKKMERLARIFRELVEVEES